MGHVRRRCLRTSDHEGSFLESPPAKVEKSPSYKMVLVDNHNGAHTTINILLNQSRSRKKREQGASPLISVDVPYQD